MAQPLEIRIIHLIMKDPYPTQSAERVKIKFEKLAKPQGRFQEDHYYIFPNNAVIKTNADQNFVSLTFSQDGLLFVQDMMYADPSLGVTTAEINVLLNYLKIWISQLKSRPEIGYKHQRDNCKLLYQQYRPYKNARNITDLSDLEKERPRAFELEIHTTIDMDPREAAGEDSSAELQTYQNLGLMFSPGKK